MRKNNHQYDAARQIADALQDLHSIGAKIILPAASEVDRNARFPHEAVQALRERHLLSVYIPREYDGMGYGVCDLVSIAQTLAQYCASTAMIWAMHQIQVACLVHHGQASPFFQEYLRALAGQQFILASVTSEVGVGGDIRQSIAALEKHEKGYALNKKSTAISYGEYADGFLITARRSPEASPGDQVLVLVQREDASLEKTGPWNTLGMRGTCSPGFAFSATFSGDSILLSPFADIATQTMVPFSHLLWSACWLGIATSALARAQKLMQSRARQQRTTTLPGDTRLAEAASLLSLMRTTINEMAREYEHLLLQPGNIADATSNMKFIIKLNNTKLLSSR